MRGMRWSGFRFCEWGYCALDGPDLNRRDHSHLGSIRDFGDSNDGGCFDFTHDCE